MLPKKKLKEIYEKDVKPRLIEINEFRLKYFDKVRIAKELGVPSVVFNDMVKEYKELQQALEIPIELKIDQLEMMYFKKAIKDGNVNAIKEILQVENPDKWAKEKNEFDIEAPQVIIKVEDASRPKEELEAITKDLEERVGKFNKGEA